MQKFGSQKTRKQTEHDETITDLDSNLISPNTCLDRYNNFSVITNGILKGVPNSQLSILKIPEYNF